MKESVVYSMKGIRIIACLLMLFLMFPHGAFATTEIPYVFPYADADGDSVSVFRNLPEFLWTWGPLLDEYSGVYRDTLTADQRELIRFPQLDEDRVFWLPNAKRYHAVDWCYTILYSTDIQCGSVAEATTDKKRTPCSKCVGAYNGASYDATLVDITRYIQPDPADLSGFMVWVPVNGGRRYHKTQACSDMLDPVRVDAAIAQAHGFTSCKRCKPD